jgi:hypothetical protein
MSNLVEIKPPRQEEWDRAAAYLRDLADRYERGDITECIVVLNDRTSSCYETWGDFVDRWRLMGAIEYAKAKASAI